MNWSHHGNFKFKCQKWKTAQYLRELPFSAVLGGSCDNWPKWSRNKKFSIKYRMASWKIAIWTTINQIVLLANWRINIFYVIGGAGSMIGNKGFSRAPKKLYTSCFLFLIHNRQYLVTKKDDCIVLFPP